MFKVQGFRVQERGQKTISATGMRLIGRMGTSGGAICLRYTIHGLREDQASWMATSGYRLPHSPRLLGEDGGRIAND